MLSKDEEAQKKGIVAISYAVGCPRFQSVQMHLRKAIPIHIACQHFAYDDPGAFSSATYGIAMLNKVQRVRFRTHVGTHVECQYALATYGIPLQGLAVNANGDISTFFHLDWIKRLREKEVAKLAQALPFPIRSKVSASPAGGPKGWPDVVGKSPTAKETVNLILHPDEKDILFGRGKSVVEHPGNTWFRDIVDNFMLRYEAGTRKDKAIMGDLLVSMVKNAGGRFLKSLDDGACWEQVDDNTARKKVAHTFRNRRKFHTTPLLPLPEDADGPDGSSLDSFLLLLE